MIIAVFLAIVFLLAGLLCLFRPQFWRNFNASGSPPDPRRGVLGWVMHDPTDVPAYRLYLGVVGALLLCLSLLFGGLAIAGPR